MTDARVRRGRRLAVAATLAAALAASAATDEPVVTDDCGADPAAHLDLCALDVDVTGTTAAPDRLLVTLTVAGDVASRTPLDHWEAVLHVDGCAHVISTFHEAGSDGPRDTTTRMARVCRGRVRSTVPLGGIGMAGSQLTIPVDRAAWEAVGTTLAWNDDVEVWGRTAVGRSSATGASATVTLDETPVGTLRLRR